MFLSYISQILSNFDFEKDSYLDNLIHKLAQKYPNGLYFPFKLSLEHYKKYNSSKVQKELVQRIDLIVSNPLIEKFSRSVMSLCLPANLLYIHAWNIFHDITEDEIRTDQQFQDKLSHMHSAVFENDMFGEEFKKIEKFKLILAKLKTLSCKFIIFLTK